MNPHLDLDRTRRVDLPIFERELDGFLPNEIYDIHVHLHTPEHGVPTPEAIRESWAAEAPHILSREQLGEVLGLVFPGRRHGSLVFANPSKWVDLEAANAHVAQAIAAGQADGLLVTRPEWPVADLRRLLHEGGFLGFKPYPGLVGGRFDENVTFEDFLPEAHQQLADELGLIVMLHLPRPDRLRDPRNQDEVRRLVERHPNLRLVIAHIGRAYTMAHAETGLPALRDLPVHWDFAMNLNADVLALAMELLGPERLVYGSDLPIALMRGMRRHEGESYINYSDGDYRWNTPEKRQPPEVEAEYTLYIYEELRAFKAAAERMGWGPAEVRMVMNGNARRLVGAVERP